MILKTSKYPSPQGFIHIKTWIPSSEEAPVGIFQIHHGLMEHSGLYEELAKHLTEAGYIVVAHDARGHGKTSEDMDSLGVIPKDGWAHFIGDTYQVTQEIKHDYPKLPITLFGHSMGAYIVEHVLTHYPDTYTAAILSAPIAKSPARLNLAQKIASLFCKLRGPKNPAATLEKLLIKNFNKPFGGDRKSYLWLSRDKEFVQDYINDTYSGLQISNGFYKELFGGMSQLMTSKFIEKLPKDLPYLIINGGQDQVNENGKEVTTLIETLKSAGIKNISHHFYPEGRHVMIKELNKAEVITRLINWLPNSSRI